MKGQAVIFAVALVTGADLACGAEEIVVADVPAAPTNGECLTDADCSPDAFCAKEACGPIRGLCQRRPVVCGNEASPVCGCNGVSYWNDCLRREAGVAAAVAGECVVNPAGCGGAGDLPCPAGAVCARLIPNRDACGAAVPGVCWGLPTTCPGRGGPSGQGGDPDRGGPDEDRPAEDAWVSCANPKECLGVCEAMRRGPAFRGDCL